MPTTANRTTIQELAAWQGCEVPVKDDEIKDLIRVIVKEGSYKASKLAPEVILYLDQQAKRHKSRRGIELPVDAEEKDIEVEAIPETKAATEREEETIPNSFACEESYHPMQLGYIIDLRSKGELLIPEIQRLAIWSDSKKELFIKSLFSKVLIFPFTFVHEGEGKPFELLDGLQRITAIMDFIEDKIHATLEVSGKESKMKWSELSDVTQRAFLQRRIGVTQAVVAAEHWPLLFRLLNMAGSPMNEYEGRRSTYITRCPLTKMLDTITNPQSKDALDSATVWCEVFGFNDRFKGLYAVDRALMLAEDANLYVRPMKTALDRWHAEKLVKPFPAKEIKKLRERLSLIFEALKERMGNRAFKVNTSSRTNNLGLVDALIYGGLLFQEAGLDSVDELGASLVELKKRLLTSSVINLKDDTSKKEAVLNRMSGTQKRVESIIAKRAD